MRAVALRSARVSFVAPRLPTVRSAGFRSPQFPGLRLLQLRCVRFAATSIPAASTSQRPTDPRYSINNRLALSLLHDPPEKALRTFDDTLRVGQLSPRISTWSAAVFAAGRAGRVDKALDYWNMLISATPPFGTKISMPKLPLPEKFYTTMIGVLVAHRRYAKAEELYADLCKHYKDRPIEAARNVVYATAMQGRVGDAHNFVLSYSKPPRLDLYYSLFSALKSANLSTKANDLFYKMAIDPDARIYGLLLAMHEREFIAAWRIWQRFLTADLPIKETTPVYRGILVACTLAKRHPEMTQILTSSGVPRTPALYVAMMTAYLQTNEPLAALATWQEAKAAVGAMDGRLFTQGLYVLCRTGHAEEAMGLLTTPALQRFVDLHAINTVIFGALRLGRDNVALGAFALLQQRKLKPDLHTLSPFIQFYAASDNLAKATEFMEMLQGAGIRADAAVLNAMLEMSARLGLDENMLNIYRHALAETVDK